MTDDKPTSEMVSAGVASVTQNIHAIMRGEINAAQLAERCWKAMEDSREPRIFRGRFALNELAIISDLVDPARVNTDMPISDQVYQTCEMVKRMAEDLGRIERERDKQRLRADRQEEITEKKIQLADKLSAEVEEQRERAEETEKHLYKATNQLDNEKLNRQAAENKARELRLVIQEMVELGSDHIDTANESLVGSMEGKDA